MSIPYKDFVHPVDKATTEAMRSIPGFDAVCKKVTELLDERAFKISATASLIKLGPNQYPSIYEKLLPICDKLQIETPELYLASGLDSQYEVFGDTQTFIILDYGVFWSFSLDELEVVLAQACGHILCRHALYNAIAEVIEAVGQELVSGIITSAIVKSVRSGLRYWKKCSNFSADRVAVYYLKDSKPVVEMLAKMAGAAPCVPGEINLDEFVAQGRNYRELLDKSKLNKVLTLFNPINPKHPLAVYRAASAVDFHKEFDYEGFERALQQQTIRSITEGSENHYKVEITFANAKTTGVQFLASKIRNAMNTDPLQVVLRGVIFSIAPGKNWTNTLNKGTYNLVFKTHNKRSEYSLNLINNTRLVVEWNDKTEMIMIKEENLDPNSVPNHQIDKIS